MIYQEILLNSSDAGLQGKIIYPLWVGKVHRCSYKLNVSYYQKLLSNILPHLNLIPDKFLLIYCCHDNIFVFNNQWIIVPYDPHGN